MRIIVLHSSYLDRTHDLDWSGLQKLGDVEIHRHVPEEQQAVVIGDGKVVLCSSAYPIHPDVFAQCQNLQYIGILSTGYDKMDLQAAASRGIVVTNVPTYGTAAVAQYAMALLLELCHHVGENSQRVNNGDWNSQEVYIWNTPPVELAGKTIGIIGCGRIGIRMAELANAFGMKVLGYDAGPAKEHPDIHFTDLDSLYRESDVISLHCPLLPTSEKMISQEALKKMKDGVLFINTARGGLVDDNALADALKSGKVAAAGLDVVSVEPLLPDSPLRGLPNCMITPHLAWAPVEARQRLLNTAVDNIQAFLSGRPVNQLS